MVREITMFELQFDGARFGPRFGSESEGEDAEEAKTGPEHDSTAEASGSSKLRALIAVVGVVLLVTALRRLRNRRSGDDYDIPLEDEESESLTPEQ
jgi:hypothetical protein